MHKINLKKINRIKIANIYQKSINMITDHEVAGSIPALPQILNVD